MPFWIVYIFAVAGFIGLIIKTSELLDKTARNEFKKKFSLWINNKLNHHFNWSENFLILFGMVMGKRHISWKCFFRSSIASYFSLFIVRIVYLSLNRNPELFNIKHWVIILVYSLLSNIVPDYISLLETRWIIARIRSSSTYFFVLQSSFFLLLDVILTGLISYAGISLMLVLLDSQELPLPLNQLISFSMRNDDANIFSIWWYTAFSTSIWVWIYFCSMHLARITNLILTPLRGFREVLNINDYPFSFLGWITSFIFIILFFALPFFVNLPSL